MVRRIPTLIRTAALAAITLLPGWSTAQTMQGYGQPRDVAAKDGASAAQNTQGSNTQESSARPGCCGIPWIGPAMASCPAGRHATGICETWRAGFIGLKYRCCFRRSYGYPYYGPSYPLLAQSFPIGGCTHPVIATVYVSGYGVACGHRHAHDSVVSLPSGPEMVAPPGGMGPSGAPANTSALPPVKPAPPRGNTAHLQLRVPEKAEVLVDDRKTARTGDVRQFVSPPLTPGKNFTYQITIRYRDDNGAAMEEKHSVRVRANDRLQLDFTGTAKLPSDPALPTSRLGSGTLPVSAEH